MKKVLIYVLLAAINLCPLAALDFVFKLEPVLLFPKEQYMSFAPGAVFSGGIDLFNLLTLGAEGGYIYEKPSGNNQVINVAFGGANLGLYYYPFSRIYLGAGGAVGISSYTSQLQKEGQGETKSSFSDIYYRAFGELGFRVNPRFSVNAFGGYAGFCAAAGKESFISGPYAGLSLRFSGSAGGNSRSSSLSVRVVQDSLVYPVYSAVYGTEPFGSIYIRNDDGAELRNVKVYFHINRYTSGTKLCGTAYRINRHSTMTFPLCADFSGEILKYTENGKVSGEVIIEYEFLGKKMTAVESVVISVNNRNAFEWSNYAGLAAFISPDSQEIAAFAKDVAGITRNNLYTGMNANLQYAVGMVEGLRLAGIMYSEDTSSPYKEYHLSDKLDSIQYPLQTLQYLSGDYDELGILLCSCLQTVNVPTGFMPLEEDFLVLVKLGISPSKVLSNFASEDGLLIDEESDSVYLALSMASLSKGFTASYKAGSEALTKCLTSEDTYYEFIDTTDAWSLYKPVAYSNNSNVTLPKQDILVKSIKLAIQNYIDSDIEAVIKRERAAGNTNKLGVALVRAGRYSEAKREFQKLSTVSAMNNTANIFMIEKNYAAAAAQYRRVLEKDPSNKIALKGLESANSKIE